MACKSGLIAVAIGWIIGFGMLVSCGEHSDKQDVEHLERVKNIDSLVRAQMNTNLNDALAYIDSLETSGSASKPVLYYSRGVVYNAMMQKTTAMLFFQKALDGDGLLQECPELFYKACDNLSIILSNRGNNAEALEVANRCYEVARQDNTPLGRQWTSVILHAIGYFDMQLGMKEEAERNFSMSYMGLSQIVNADSSYPNLQTYARVSLNILDAYTTTGQYEVAVEWLQSAEIAADKLSESPQCTDADRAKYVGGIALQKALVMTKLGKKAEADEAYQEAQEVGYFNTTYGILEQTAFLKASERWDEIVELMPKVDSVATVWNVPYSLFYIKEYMAPRFTAFIKSGRKEQALALAEQLMDNIDSIAANEQHHEMQEISVIAKQKDKNTEAARQEAAEAYRWVKILSITLSVLVVAILAYIVVLYIKRKK